MIIYKSLTDLREQAKEEGMKGTGRKNEDEIKEFFLDIGKKIIKDIDEEIICEVKEVSIKTLRFLTPVWCAYLNRNYSEGFYQPASKEEYEALKPYSQGE